jgi:hypothetical protein
LEGLRVLVQGGERERLVCHGDPADRESVPLGFRVLGGRVGVLGAEGNGWCGLGYLAEVTFLYAALDICLSACHNVPKCVPLCSLLASLPKRAFLLVRVWQVRIFGVGDVEGRGLGYMKEGG